MAILTKAPRGTVDVLPGESYKWQYIESVLRDAAATFGFREMRVPTFEHTELFNRGVGDTTDVVQKEMYTFEDKGGRSITLRPEGTAGVCRSAIEHGLLGDALPLKVYYFVSCFRYEKPQMGRYREHTQFGSEFYGSAAPAADAELICYVQYILDSLGIKETHLEINSIGCPKCRTEYYKALREYFRSYSDQLCETCLGRLEKNPMRILDCKSPICKEIAANAPRTLDYLCDECREHFNGLKARLDKTSIKYVENSRIVRGLDYYNRTVFEFVTDALGSQGTVCGGGRYDGLAESLGGPSVPSLGFGMGLNRILMLMEQTGCEFPEVERCDIYVGSVGESASIAAAGIISDLRAEGFKAEGDVMIRSVKAQMKYCDKIGAKYSCIIGDNEQETGKVRIKNMKTGEAFEVELDGMCQFMYDRMIADAIEDAAGAAEDFGG